MKAPRTELDGVVHIDRYEGNEYTLCGIAMDEYEDADGATKKVVSCEKCLEIIKYYKSLRVT